MGNKIELLKKSYNLLLKSEKILKLNFEYEGSFKNSFIDEEKEVIIIEDELGNYIQYDICDCYTSLIKVLKTYRCEEINSIYEDLKKISLQVETIY